MSARINSLYYWFQTTYATDRRNGWVGPKRGAIIYRRRVVKINFQKPNDNMKVRDAALREEEAVATALGPASKQRGWSAQFVNPHGGTSWCSGASLRDVAIKVRKQVAKEYAEEAAIQADPVRHLERELSWHDWYSAYSDDYRVVCSGDAHWAEIREIAKKVPDAVADALWQKYAPEDSRAVSQAFPR